MSLEGFPVTRSEPCQLRVPAKILLVLAAVISVLSSFAGGYMMHLEGQRVIEETVKEVSAADTAQSTAALAQSFHDVYWASSSYGSLLSDWHEFGTLVDMKRFFERDQWAKTSNSESVYSLGILVIPLHDTVNSRNALYQMVWWDPLSDEAAIAANGGSTRVWVTGVYLPHMWGDPSCHPAGTDMASVPNGEKRCVAAYAMDPVTGHQRENVYNYTDLQLNQVSDELPRWNKQQEGWRTEGATWWRAAAVWYSPDDTPYAYAGYYRTLPLFPSSHPLLARYKVTLPTFISFHGWQDKLGGFNTEAILVASFLDFGLDSQVFGTNSGDRLMKTGCNRVDAALFERNPCIVALVDLSRTIQDAARVLNRTAENSFLRQDIAGGEHWLRRSVIHKAEEDDELQSIHMLWLRPTSSVQDKTQRALYLFIGFVGCVLVFEIFILAIQLVKIGVPLVRLASAMAFIDTLSLDEAEEKLTGVADSCVTISEISKVVHSFLRAVGALRLYKGFLPQSALFLPVDDVDNFISSFDIPSELNHSEVDSSQRRAMSAGSGLQKDDVNSTMESGAVPPGTLHGPLRLDSRRLSGGSSASRFSVRSPSVAGSPRVTAAAHTPGHGPRGFAEFMKRPVTLSVGNMRHTHRRMLNPAQLREELRKMVVVVSEVSITKGVVDGFVGDHFRCSWNAVRPVIGHRARAALSTGHTWAAADRGQCNPITLAVVGGDVLCGHAGTEFTRYHAIVGPVVSFAHVAERYAHSGARREGSCVLAEGRVRSEQDKLVHFRWHSVVVYPPRGSYESVTMWEVVGIADQGGGGEEWMYQLAQAESQHPCQQYNKAAMLCLRGELEKAAELCKATPLNAKEYRLTAEFLAMIEAAQRGDGPLPSAALLLTDVGTRKYEAEEIAMGMDHPLTEDLFVHGRQMSHGAAVVRTTSLGQQPWGNGGLASPRAADSSAEAPTPPEAPKDHIY
eukprot:TRINITY_DN874_c0_g1_i1.p1 TRINITY_DN874_c0_g1~~TRINITY_DN874_c0_g1_i1.p1  ORF type:complete len:960 (+),score=229.06 TRINITY_DN874_c0_g1_i1:119-2998(+)